MGERKDRWGETDMGRRTGSLRMKGNGIGGFVIDGGTVVASGGAIA